MPISRFPPFFRIRFVIVNAFTSVNLLIGVLSLIAAATGAIGLAAWGLICCVLLDACDGSLARHWRVVTDFGAQLDSLADMTSFIIAGTTLTFYWARSSLSPMLPALAISSLYALSGAIRLARFNSSPSSREYFQGVPTTFGAAVIAVNYLADPVMPAHWLLLLVGVLAILMVSIFPYPKLATLRRAPPIALPLLLISTLINPTWTIWLLTALYLGLGPLISLYRRRSPLRG